jgi:predicted RND superfamily exporter protein
VNEPAVTPGRVCRAFVPWVVRHRRAVLSAALLVSLVSAVFAAKLYSNLRSGFEELLPDTAPSVIAARTIGPKLHNVTHLSVVLEGDDGDALERLADDLAERLRRLPAGIVDSVEYRTDDQERYVRRFGGFYLSLQDLDTIQRRIDRRIAWEKRKANPLTNLLGGDDDLGPPPPVDFTDIEGKYATATGEFAKFRKGYFQTPDGHILVLLVRPPESATGLEANQRVLDAVRKEVAALEPQRYDPTVRIGYDGEVATLVEEQAALVSDLASSTVVVVVLVVLALWIYFHRWTAILSIFGALAVGCALTFGLSWFLVGYLNASTAFLGSIVVGNGINVSIIIVARFLEERRRGRSMEEALETSWSGTLAATFVAAFGAALAYLSLAVTGFRGFSQFGLIGGIGMALCWVSAYVLVPPLLAALDSRSKRALGPGRHPVIGRFVNWLNARHCKVVQVVSLALLAASVVGVLTYRGEVIQYDLSKLRAAKSAESGAQFWGSKVDQVFRAYLTPLVIRAESPAQLQAVVAALDAERKALGAADPFREVRSLSDLVPPDSAAKRRRLERLRDTLTDSRIAKMDPELRRKVLDVRPPADLRAPTIGDLPEALRLPMIERDGSAGRIALVFPKKIGWLTARDSQQMTDLIRGAIARSGAKAQAVGQSLLFIDIANAILRDGPVATLIALCAVVALVALALRRLRPTVQVLASLLLGVAWLVGFAAWTRVRLNFLNFVVLPITFGIGVDYAVNVVQRWHREGRDSLPRVLSDTGGAVALCSITTIIGYASLLVADSRALRGFGLLASIGELACVTAALVALPAWLLTPSAARSR